MDIYNTQFSNKKAEKMRNLVVWNLSSDAASDTLFWVRS